MCVKESYISSTGRNKNIPVHNSVTWYILEYRFTFTLVQAKADLIKRDLLFKEVKCKLGPKRKLYQGSWWFSYSKLITVLFFYLLNVIMIMILDSLCFHLLDRTERN